MKKILGLDLGTNSIGWALVEQADSENERSNIIKLGVRVNPLTVDELLNFEKGKSITTNADRTLKRGMRRNLQRFKLRKDNLIEILKENGFITAESILSETGNKSTFETFHFRAKAVTEKITLEQFARVLLMINKKRGYKSSRKSKTQEEGKLIDGMEIAKKLYNDNITPGQYVLELLKENKKYIPDFYRSDLQNEFDRIFDKQLSFHSSIISPNLKEELRGKKRDAVWAICAQHFKEKGVELVGIKRQGKLAEQKLENYEWRKKGLTEKLEIEQLVIVLQQINMQLNSSSGYLGSISDRSKELYFNKETVGQFLIRQLNNNPHAKLKNHVFYRQDYLDEFNIIWETQSKFHTLLNNELKNEIRDVIIFYQRRLKSQKGLVSLCEFENKKIEVVADGKKIIKTIGNKVCPKSSPLFQEFKIWQILNNIQVIEKFSGTQRCLNQEEKEILFKELNIKDKITKSEALKLLFENHKVLDLNYKDLEGNRTNNALFKAYQTIIEISGNGEYDFSKLNADKVIEIVTSVFEGLGYNSNILSFNSDLEKDKLEKQPSYQLWHLLYSFEGDNTTTGIGNLIQKITEKYGFEKEYATILANVGFQPEYGSLSTKAIRKILPHLKEGNEFSVACTHAGYKHSKDSLTKEEKEKKPLKNKLDILSKNSLRNPVVEKILNQMINVVNTLIDSYGKPDEIRIELARELKKSAKEREELTAAISKSTAEHEKFRTILQKEFGLTHVSRNDIIRYKLYLELEHTGFHTLYSNKYIEPNKLFSKEFDIEHIIPQSRLFDDSFSNKTLESRSINIEKGNETAYDYIKSKYDEKGLSDYLNRIEDLYKSEKISKAKYNKLKMEGKEIPDNFIARDLRDTQYIAKKAKSILEELAKDVISTSGIVTNRLREDWQLIDLMKELNWDKYNKLGLTEIIENKDGHKINRIKDWTKRNDHRHHAMDALAIAFTKPVHIQYLNNLNAKSDKSSSIFGIETKELYRDDKNKLRFKPPIPLIDFRVEAKKHLENILVSIKAKNKVTTININTTKKRSGLNKKKQLTPRGQLHLETIYGSIKQYVTNEEKVGANFNKETILTVANKKCREALLKRLEEFDNDSKKAFTGKNSLEKNPLYFDKLQTYKIPLKVKTVRLETLYTIRKEITPDLKIDKVIDLQIKKILEKRLKDFNNDSKKAFSNLDQNPIWLNKEKGVLINRVTITGINNAEALHSKKDKEGNLILDKEGKLIPVDFVNTGNNHHVAIYKDEHGELQENVISFFEAATRVNLGLPVIDKSFKEKDGWQFLFSMKQNEYFVFPNEQTDFKPNEIDLLNPENYHLVSPYLYRVQKFSKVIYGNSAVRDYVFRHHLETKINDSKELKDLAYKSIKSLSYFKGIIKVRVNHIGQIVSVGE